MWTSVLDLRPQRTVPTQLLGRFWRGASLAPFAPLQVQNTPRPPLPATNWVRVRNRLGGISGCDLRLLYGESDPRTTPAALPIRTPYYPGHEVVGEVIEVGSDVEYLNVGDRVVLQYDLNCITAGVQPLCRFCANGMYNLCERVDLPGPYPIGGGWSEEMLLHEQQLYPIPPDLSDEQAVMLEPTAIALHAVLRHTPRPTDQVLIIGAGTLGLLTLMIVHMLVPRAQISVLVRHSFQVEQATRLGAAHIIYPHNSYAAMQQITAAHLYKGLLGNKTLIGGYDHTFDTIGSQKTLSDALRWTRANGTVVLVGQNPHLMHIDLTPIWHQELRLVGSRAHGTETWPLGSNTRTSTFSVVEQLMEQELLQPERLITHRFALTEYREALKTALYKEQNHAIKIVFDYAKQPTSVVPNARTSYPLRPRPGRRAPAPDATSRPRPGDLPVIPAPPVPEAPESPDIPTITITPDEVIAPPPSTNFIPGDATIQQMIVTNFDYEHKDEEQPATRTDESASSSPKEENATNNE